MTWPWSKVPTRTVTIPPPHPRLREEDRWPQPLYSAEVAALLDALSIVRSRRDGLALRAALVRGSLNHLHAAQVATEERIAGPKLDRAIGHLEASVLRYFSALP